jgi:hypothetical protein
MSEVIVGGKWFENGGKVDWGRRAWFGGSEATDVGSMEK